MLRFKNCAVAGCDRNAHRDGAGKRGWCVSHYEKWRKYGDPLIGRVNLLSASATGVCKIDGCTDVHHSNGYCGKHYYHFKAKGNPLGGGTSPGDPIAWLRENVGYSQVDCLVWPFGRSRGGTAVLPSNTLATRWPIGQCVNSRTARHQHLTMRPLIHAAMVARAA